VNQAELPFDARTLARSTDPQTSKDAASASRELRALQHRTIMAVMEIRPAFCVPRDFTADEIAALCDLDRHQVGRRLGELEREGLVRRTGNKRPTPSGRMAQCYEVVQ